MGSSNVPLRLGYRIIDGLGTLCQIARVVSEWPPKIPTILPNFQCTCFQSETTCKFSTMTAAVDNRCWWKKMKSFKFLSHSIGAWGWKYFMSQYTWLDWTAQTWLLIFELCRTQCVQKKRPDFARDYLIVRTCNWVSWNVFHSSAFLFSFDKSFTMLESWHTLICEKHREMMDLKVHQC